MHARAVSLGVLVLVLLLASCGGRTSATRIGTPTNTKTMASTPTAQPSNLLAPNVGIAQTVAGLQARIVSLDDWNGDVLPQYGLDCERHLVLARPPTAAVSPADVQAIKDFLAKSPIDSVGEPMPGAPLPSSLLWASGWADGLVPSAVRSAPCEGMLELSNAGSQPIAISGAGVVIDVGPIAPSFHYNQLDLCSLGANYDTDCLPLCTGGCGGQGSCGYGIDIVLGDDVQPGMRYGAAVSSPNVSSACPWPLVLNPGDSTDIFLNVSPPIHSPTGIYRVTPFVVTDGGESVE